MSLQVHTTCTRCHSMRVVTLPAPGGVMEVEHRCESDPQGPGDPRERFRTPAGVQAWRFEASYFLDDDA